MRRKLVVVAMLVFSAVVTMPTLAQQSDGHIKALKAEISALKAGQAAIRNDLAHIKRLLIQSSKRSRVTRRKPAIETVDLTMALAGYPSKGASDAKVTLVEFSDFQCPFCRRHTLNTLPQIEKDFIKSGKVRYVIRDFPIKSIHPYAFKAAEAANCAGDQGKYWAMHERLFANPKQLAPDNMPAHAEAIKLDVDTFNQCIGSGKHLARIRQSLTDGVKAGVNATPIFFLGISDAKNGQVKIVSRIRGARPYRDFKKAIEDLLKSKS